MTNQATKEFINQHKNDDVKLLALKTKLPNVDYTFALQQIQSLQMAVMKLPLWAATEGILYPIRLSMEQCSNEQTAQYKLHYIHQLIGKELYSFADITGGFGVDCTYFSHYAKEINYVEMNCELCDIVQHNFCIFRESNTINIPNDVNIHNTTAEEFIKENSDKHFDFIYADPARRGNLGQKLISVADCQPNIIELQGQLLKMADWVMIKLSPMLDIKKAISELNNVYEVLILSTNNECKELIIVLGQKTINEPKITAVEIRNNNAQYITSGLLSTEHSTNTLYSTPLRYLYEPYAAQLKSGLFKTLTEQYNVSKISQHAHLYTSNEAITDFPGRMFIIDSVYPFAKKVMTKIVSSYPKANIATRHFPLTANDIHKRYKINDGGDIYLFATTTNDGNKILVVCHKT